MIDNKIQFYPEVKAHISPSAMNTWYNSPSGFVKSYFMQEKSKETAAMKGGKEIHALIEAGLLTVQHHYFFNEVELTHVFDSGVKVFGKPDSFELDSESEVAMFVDYKSGRENNWDNSKLATDIKMKLTAWLIWQHYNRTPMSVKGFIEHVPTQWNKELKEVEPTGGETIVAGEIMYTASELQDFTATVVKTIADVNEAYLVWLESSDEFVNQDDVAEYASKDEQMRKLEADMDIIKDRIADQMKMGSKKTLPTVFGSFFFKDSKKWEYPKGMRINYLDYGLTIEDTDEINAAAKAATKKFELENEPVEVVQKLQFRASTKK